MNNRKYFIVRENHDFNYDDSFELEDYFENEYDISEWSVIVMPDRYRDYIEEPYKAAEIMFNSMVSDREYFEDDFKAICNSFKYIVERKTGKSIYPYQVNKLVKLIDRCIDDEDVENCSYSDCFVCDDSTKNDILCEMLNIIFLGSYWESFSIHGCCQGDYAEIIVNTKSSWKNDFYVRRFESVFFNLGDTFSVYDSNDEVMGWEYLPYDSTLDEIIEWIRLDYNDDITFYEEDEYQEYLEEKEKNEMFQLRLMEEGTI